MQQTTDTMYVKQNVAQSTIDCKYGVKCNDFTREHRNIFSHSTSKKLCKFNPCKFINDDDHLSKFTHSQKESTDHSSATHYQSKQKFACKFGIQCINMSMDHRQKFSHDEKINDPMDCKFGLKCNDTTPEHRHRFMHKSEPIEPKITETKNTSNRGDVPKPFSRYGSNDMTSEHRPKLFNNIECRYGSNCNDLTSEHRNRFSHNESHAKSNIECRYGFGCTNMDQQHRDKFTHPTGKKMCKHNPCRLINDESHLSKYTHDHFNENSMIDTFDKMSFGH